jgi:nicotinamidase-related amidase
MLSKENTTLVLVDFQEKLIKAMCDKEDLIKSVEKLVRASNILGLPILWTEQNPRGLGPTIPEITSHLEGADPPHEKLAFSACGEPEFLESLKKLNRKQILLAGIESHVCVYQTAADLLEIGHEVQVVTDCTSSRTPSNRAIGWERMKLIGATLTSMETALFEMLGRAEGEEFKSMLPVIK